MSEDIELFVPTLNQQGYATVNMDPFSEKFTQYTNGQFLEIGAAFGYTTLKALENSANVIANDLETRHLRVHEHSAKKRGFNQLKTITAAFPI